MSVLNKKQRYRINLIIISIITIGFALTMFINTLTYSSIIKHDIENISKLSSTNIYSEINNELIKPIFVSLTMANDSFLVNWIEEEGAEDVDSLVAYLNAFKDKYGYNSVFMISDSSMKYYHYKGIHKTISPTDAHDDWYFDFINSGKSYDLDVDVDQVDSNALTVFVNCRVEDSDGNLIGVVGVGLKMDTVQKILDTFEKAYDLEAFLVDSDGIVQVHTDSSLIELHNIHEDEVIASLSEDIFSNKSTLETYRYTENGIDGYLITRYVDDLEWTLVVRKDTSVLRRTLYNQMGEVFIVIIAVTIAVILISNYVINQFQNKMSQMAKTDELTGLNNRRGFNERLYESLRESEASSKTFTVFIFDIDHFKILNDQFGHLYGDKVITLIAHQSHKILSKYGIVARWGGDEFAGIIYEETNNTEVILNELLKSIKSNREFGDKPITLSMGVTTSRLTDTPDIIIGRADKALYKAKESGKDCLRTI